MGIFEERVWRGRYDGVPLGREARQLRGTAKSGGAQRHAGHRAGGAAHTARPHSAARGLLRREGGGGQGATADEDVVFLLDVHLFFSFLFSLIFRGFGLGLRGRSDPTARQKELAVRVVFRGLGRMDGDPFGRPLWSLEGGGGVDR